MRVVTKVFEKKSFCTRRRHAGKEIQGDLMSHALGAQRWEQHPGQTSGSIRQRVPGA